MYHKFSLKTICGAKFVQIVLSRSCGLSLYSPNHLIVPSSLVGGPSHRSQAGAMTAPSTTAPIGPAQLRSSLFFLEFFTQFDF
jgi:hypothetical protein